MVTRNGLSRDDVHDGTEGNYIGASSAILGSISEGGDRGRRVAGRRAAISSLMNFFVKEWLVRSIIEKIEAYSAHSSGKRSSILSSEKVSVAAMVFALRVS